MLKFAFPPTPNLKFASQWNIGGVGSSGVGHVYFMYISCIFHVVCASFSALATRKLADAKADSSGIWTLDIRNITLCDVTSSLVSGLPLKSCECRNFSVRSQPHLYIT